MDNKQPYTKMLCSVKLLSCPLAEFENEATRMLDEKYEPIGAVATVLKNDIIICTQLWGEFRYVDHEGIYHNNPWDEPTYWGDGWDW